MGRGGERKESGGERRGRGRDEERDEERREAGRDEEERGWEKERE